MQRIGSITTSLVLGLLGGILFQFLGLPLPWILGPLLFNVAATMSGAKVRVPDWLKLSMFTVLGAMFGMSVSPELPAQITRWLPSIGMIFLFVVVVVAMVTLYLHKVAGFDWVTAYFSATPGSLLAMLALGESYGGDPRTMSLIHLVRLIITVFSIPLAFQFFGGHESLGGLDLAHLEPGFGWLDMGLLIALCLTGYLAARLARFPAPQLIGPMLLIGAAKLLDFDVPSFPPAVIAVAQVVIGSAVGATFAGIRIREVTATLAHGVGVGTLMLAVALTFTLLTQELTGLPFAALLLSFAPGGLAEMSLVGFALGLDVTLIMTHQVSRYLFVTLVAPLVVSFIRRQTCDSVETKGG